MSDPRLGHRCARCGAAIPDDAEGDRDWFYVPDAGVPEDAPAPGHPLEPRGQVICADCNS